MEKIAQLFDTTVECLCVSSMDLIEDRQTQHTQTQQSNISHHHHYYGENTFPIQIIQLQQEKEQLQERYEALVEQLRSEITYLKELIDSMNKDK